MRAIYLDDMTHDVVLVEDDGYESLPFLQALVDGLIEFADIQQTAQTGYLHDPQPFLTRWHRAAQQCSIVVNEEGSFNDMFVYNRRASFLCGEWLFGPAAIVQVGTKGETLPISLENAVFLFEVLLFPLPFKTLTVEQVCQKYIVPRGTIDLSEA